MAQSSLSPVYETKSGKVGVIIINLGTPDATTYSAVRRYLSEFLSDPRVIETPKWLWQPILQGIVLTFRPHKSAKAYKRIWNTEHDESPLRHYTRLQAASLAEYFAPKGIEIEWAMRYGTPSVKGAIDALLARKCKKIVLFPLYPQYSATTTATANDQAFRALMHIRHQPAIRTVPAFADDDAYIQALATSLSEHLKTLPKPAQKIIASFHGLPLSYVQAGDPYQQECEKTVEALRKKLHLSEADLILTYQSRFGPAKWLSPSTEETVLSLVKQGIKSVAVITPGFLADCVETLDEIGTELREAFYSAGGEEFSLLPCLNNSPEGVSLLIHCIEREVVGWV